MFAVRLALQRRRAATMGIVSISFSIGEQIVKIGVLLRLMLSFDELTFHGLPPMP